MSNELILKSDKSYQVGKKRGRLRGIRLHCDWPEWTDCERHRKGCDQGDNHGDVEHDDQHHDDQRHGDQRHVDKNMVIKLTLVVPKKLNDVGSSCLESPFAEGDLWSTRDGKPSAIFKMV